MPQESNSANNSLIPPAAMPAGADAFTRQVHSLLDGQRKDDAAVAKVLEGWDEMFDLIAAGLYSLASMLVGEGEDSVRLVETTIATAEVSACQDPVAARQSSRRALGAPALEILEQRNPGCLASPKGMAPAGTCIEDDDLDAAGVSRDELERMIAGPDRERVRKWLQSLPTPVRTIFVLRAVAGLSAVETADLLVTHGGPKAAGWTPDGVRESFRQGLCSLASQLIQATTAR